MSSSTGRRRSSCSSEQSRSSDNRRFSMVKRDSSLKSWTPRISQHQEDLQNFRRLVRPIIDVFVIRKECLNIPEHSEETQIPLTQSASVKFRDEPGLLSTSASTPRARARSASDAPRLLLGTSSDAASNDNAEVNDDPTPFTDFESRWARTNVFSEDWRDMRGVYGETVLNWTFMSLVRDRLRPERTAVYRLLLKDLMAAAPDIVNVQCSEEPYVGQTLLHQVCAEADHDTLQLLLDQNLAVPLNLNPRMVGAFAGDVLRTPPQVAELLPDVTPFSVGDDDTHFQLSLSPLEAALVAPSSDKASIDMVRSLLQNGADPVFKNEEGDVLYTLLHVIARSRWDCVVNEDLSEEAYFHPHLSPTRTRESLDLFLCQQSELYLPRFSLTKNARGLTALQAAAAFGNRDVFARVLDSHKKFVWKWGDITTYAYPIRDIDSGHRENRLGCLEYIALMQHHDLVKLGIVKKVIQEKWRTFGRTAFRLTVSYQLIVAICSIIVCIDDYQSYSRLQWISKVLVLSLGATWVIGTLLLVLTTGMRGSWFHSLSYQLAGAHKRSIYSLLVVKGAIQMILFCVMVLVKPLLHDKKHINIAWWHIISSLIWMYFLHYLLDFFQLFEHTAFMASALPQLVFYDMIPFLSIYFVMVFFFAVALRIAAAETSEGQVLGDLWRTFMTLEEAIHGPDARWRHIFETHPGLTFMGFVTFLWVTAMMMTMLIAAFSERYEGMRKRRGAFFLFYRASFMITIEKIWPAWIHKIFDIHIGEHLGDGESVGLHGSGSLVSTFSSLSVGRQDDTQHTQPVTPIRKPRTSCASSSSESDAEEITESTPLLALPSKDRYFLWQVCEGDEEEAAPEHPCPIGGASSESAAAVLA